MDGNGGCCIARWANEGHVATGYDMTKMDMIMLKYRPIAPKPASGSGSGAATSDSGNNSPRDGRHAKAPARGRRKMNTSNNNNNNNYNSNKRCSNSGKKRKSSSPDTQHHHHNQTAESAHQVLDQDTGSGVTLLPLFPEAPDLSPIQHGDNNNNKMSAAVWVSFNTPEFEDNYRFCQGQGW